MTDIAIRASATAAAPRDYVIPGAQEILPKAVTATLDGTSATNLFLPCLQLLDPGGNVMFSAVSSAAVAAGASADVSWFPGLGGGSGGGWTQIFNRTVGAGGAATIDTSGTTLSNQNNWIFGTFNGSSTSATNPDQLQVHFNNDSGGNYQTTGVFGAQAQGAGAHTVDTLANNASADSVIGQVQGGGGTPFNGTILFMMPKIINTNQRATMIAFGGWNDGSVARIGVYNTVWTFTGVTRMTFFMKNGNFEPGSNITLWAV